MDDKTGVLDRVRQQVIGLARDLGLQYEVASGGAVREQSPINIPSTARMGVALAWQRANDLRANHFDHAENLFADPGWAILLDLYIHQVQGRPVTVSSACIAAKVPPTTGLRWLTRLQDDALIERTSSPSDARVVYVSLSAGAIERIEGALDAVIESDRRLGRGSPAPANGQGW